jgi:hypothetical protein
MSFKLMLLLNLAGAADTFDLVYLHFRFAVGTEKSGHVRMGQFAPSARKTPALLADTVGNVMQGNVYFLHVNPPLPGRLPNG